MGEAIISRASSSSDSSSSGPGAIAFYNNGQFVVPKTGTYHVEAVGGGGGGETVVSAGPYSNNIHFNGGASGNYSQVYINLNVGQIINIRIGDGGRNGQYNFQASIVNGNSGGTTTFGSYLSATGGLGGGRHNLNYTKNEGGHGYDIPRDYNNGPYGSGGFGAYTRGGTSYGTSGMVYISWQ